MRLSPPGHPLAHLMSPWKKLGHARYFWRHMIYAVVVKATKKFQAHGIPAISRWGVKGETACFFKAADDQLGWINLDYCILKPTKEFTDAPFLCTVALNCLPPKLGKAAAWMKSLHFRPPTTRITPGIFESTCKKEIHQEEADFFASPEEQLMAHCHLVELDETVQDIVGLQIAWLNDGGWTPEHDRQGIPIPVVRWTQTATEVYLAWQELLLTMDRDYLARLMRIFPANKKPQPKRVGQRPNSRSGWARQGACHRGLPMDPQEILRSAHLIS